MPKLFFRKKKKKAKHSLRDALAPSPAFIAVPSTPPPEKKENKFKFQSSPGKTLDISLPIPPVSSNDIVTASNAPGQFNESVGTYSLVGHEEGEGEESEAEPGYATVQAVTGKGAGEGALKDRPRLATPKHSCVEQNGNPREFCDADVELTSPLQEDDTVHRERICSGSKSPIEARPRSATGRNDENARDDSQLPPFRYENEDEQEGVGIEERSVMAVNGRGDHQQQRDHQRREDMYSKVVKPKKQGESRKMTTEDGSHFGANLPPKAPESSSPMNKRVKEKSKSPLDSTHGQMMRPRDSSSPRQQSRSSRYDQQSRILNDSDHRRWTDSGAGYDYLEKQSPDARPRGAETERTERSKKIIRHRRNTYDGYSYYDRLLPRKKEPPHYDDDIDLPLEYTDQSYLPSGEEEEDETDTITDSYFNYSGEIPGDYPDGSHTTPNRMQHQCRQRRHHQEQNHNRSRSASFPSHRSSQPHPSSQRTAPPYPHTHSYGHGHSPPRKRRRRPATSEGIPLQQRHSANIPFYHPPSLQPVYPISPDQVYVFSEFQPDGKVQYYSATPVHSPPAHGHTLSPAPPTINVAPPPSFTLPPSNQNPPPPQVTQSGYPRLSQSLSPQNMLTPSPHQVPNGGRGDEINHGGPPSSSLSDKTAAKFSRKVPTAVTESGYFSGPLGSSQQGTIHQTQRESSMNTSGSGVSPTSHSPLPREVPQLQLQPTNLGRQSPRTKDKVRPQPPPPYHLHYRQIHQHLEHQHVVSATAGGRSKSPGSGASPTRKLLESSLQIASMSPRSDFVSPTAKLPHSNKSPRLDLHVSGSGERATDTTTAAADRLSPGNVGMAALYEQKEKILKARIRALEESADDLCTENASLKQTCEALKQDASGSVEQLQKQLSSVMSKNEDYRQLNLDKDQQRDRDKNEIFHLKDELEKVKEENHQLLLAKQSVELERKEWETVSEHAQSVLDENVSLLKQRDLLKEQMKEMKLQHQAIVSQLNSEVSKGKKERKEVESKLASLQESHAQLQSQFEELVEQSSGQVSISEHQSALKEMHGLIEDLEERSDSDAKTQGAQLRILTKEKTSLVTKLTDAKAIILQLEQECTRMHKDIRVAHEKINDQNVDLEASRDREVASHERLSRAVSTAEKAIAEREAFAKIAKAQQKASERAGVKSALTGVTAGKIEKEFEMYRQETDTKLQQATTLLREKDRENRVQKRQFQREITHLQLQLKSKQRRLDDMTKNKKLAEDRLDLMWKDKISKGGLASSSLSMNPVASAAAAASGTTVHQLQGRLSKLSTHVQSS